MPKLISPFSIDKNKSDNQQPASLELLSIEEVAGLLKITKRTVYRLINAGDLPGPDLVLGKRSPRWRRSTIENWLHGQIKNSTK